MSTSARGGFFRNVLDAMITARERQARQYVANMAKIYGQNFIDADDTPRSGSGKRG